MLIYRLKMSKNWLIVICMFCKLIKISDCIAEKNSTVWSSLNLLISGRELGSTFTDIVHTTETYGIIIKTNEATTVTDGKDFWTKVDVSAPPQKTTTKYNYSESEVKYHATLGNTGAIFTKPSIMTDTENASTLSLEILNKGVSPTPFLTETSSNRSFIENVSSKTPSAKNNNGETGHAFFDDDDDDDDDDDYEDDYDDDDYEKKEKDELDEVEDVDTNAEQTAEATDTEQQDEYDNYAETRPPIILRTRRKNKKKRAKKHGHIKIKDFKKLRKFMLPLLLAYKLKFFTLVPLLLGGLVLIVATTGFAGFFFALFAVGLGLKHNHH